MSLSNVANVTSHLRNASKARLAITSIPLTKVHFKLALAMRNAGFFSAVVPGGGAPPPNHHFLSYPSVNDVHEPIEYITRQNVASRRIWLGLKYWESQPVLHQISSVSKPKRKINLNLAQLRQVLRGDRGGQVDGLRTPGECIFLLTDQGLLEAREAVEKKVGGLALCRVS